jgi:16S rRNA (uracil1498-N3)-methyltransferase
MPRFFCTEINGGIARITGDDAWHIHTSLRAKPGDEFILCDGIGFDYSASVLSASSKEIIFGVSEKRTNETEPSVRVTLYQCLPKSHKFESIIQKTVELGVYKIVPVLSELCVARPESIQFRTRLDRVNKISMSAAKQCGRGIAPEVTDLMPLDKVLQEIKGSTPTLFFYERGGEPCTRVIDNIITNVNIIIGSEGGFSPNEAEKIISAGARPATLGKRILRTETAPLAALSIVMLLTGNME